jgi:hypothetical protein
MPEFRHNQASRKLHLTANFGRLIEWAENHIKDYKVRIAEVNYDQV